MRKLVFLPVVLASIIFIGCEKDDELNRESLLNKRWIESYEEKTSDGIEIYRTGALGDFPPSWYRQVFYFDENHVCEYSVLAPNDGHYMANGSWWYLENTNIIKIFNSNSEKIYEFEIVELTNNILKLEVSD